MEKAITALLDYLDCAKIQAYKADVLKANGFNCFWSKKSVQIPAECYNLFSAMLEHLNIVATEKTYIDNQRHSILKRGIDYDGIWVYICKDLTQEKIDKESTATNKVE